MLLRLKKINDFQYLRKAINVKCKIVNVIEAWEVWLISLISMIKVFTLLQSPSGLTCSSMAIMYTIKTCLFVVLNAPCTSQTKGDSNC